MWTYVTVLFGVAQHANFSMGRRAGTTSLTKRPFYCVPICCYDSGSLMIIASRSCLAIRHCG